MKRYILYTVKCTVLLIPIALISNLAFAADRIEGRVEGAGGPIAEADVTLWVTGRGAPRKPMPAG